MYKFGVLKRTLKFYDGFYGVFFKVSQLIGEKCNVHSAALAAGAASAIWTRGEFAEAVYDGLPRKLPCSNSNA
jgi:hypothetical protein